MQKAIRRSVRLVSCVFIGGESERGKSPIHTEQLVFFLSRLLLLPQEQLSACKVNYSELIDINVFFFTFNQTPASVQRKHAAM